MRLTIQYEGFDIELDKKIKEAMKKIGFTFIGSGACGCTRDMSFKKKDN